MRFFRSTGLVAACLTFALLLGSCTVVTTNVISDPVPTASVSEVQATPAPAAEAVPEATPVVTPEITPVITPEPQVEAVPTPTPVVTSVRIVDESADEILALSANRYLTYVDATLSHEYDALAELQRRLPDCDVVYYYAIDGELYSSLDTEIASSTTEGLSDILHYLPNIDTVDLTSADVSTDEIDALKAAYPDVFFVFMLKVIGTSVRSDITCFSTLCSPDEEGGVHYFTPDLEPLMKYCTRLRALDMGHNKLKDISAISNLTELRVLILGDNQYITDLSPLGTLKNLEYLELFTTVRALDYSCLKELTNMRYLNVSNCPKLSNMDFLSYMPNLEMCWVFNCRMRQATVDEAIANYPNINIKYHCDFWGPSVTCCGWRATDYNVAIRTAFTNWRHVIEFNSWDDIQYDGAEISRWVPVTEH